jgi:NAD(P)-dependent dehydrogenase (short-subunit alcohol dehydrogenase family)
MTSASPQRVVLVTGASSGLGQATAALLARRGHRVFGTSRRPTHDGPPGVDMLDMDVRDDQSVGAALEAVLSRASRIDVLVNNAGYLLSGAIEETSVDEAKAQFDTNFFGTARMVKAVLPAMRRQGGGRIVTVGSLAGLVGVPFEGFYSASKHALEGYCGSLRHELRPFNIHVSIIEPGFFRSRLSGVAHTPAASQPEYATARQRAGASFQSAVDNGPDPERVASRVAMVIAARNPRLHYRVGREANAVPWMMALLPQRTFERGLARRFGLSP